MEHIATGMGAIAEDLTADSTQAHEAARNTGFWPSALMTLALSSITIGITWDISWHESIGRDTFWTPAHMAIYFGGVLAGCVAGWLAIQHTFIAKEAGR